MALSSPQDGSRSRGLRLISCILPVVIVLLARVPSGAFPFRIETAPEWNELFHRHHGWTGADGAISIPLSGIYAYGTSHLGPTLFSFGDTFIGEVNEKERRLHGSTMVNNTFSVLRPFTEEPGPMRFIHRLDKEGQPRAVFVPNTPNSEPGDWYWPGDGFVNHDLDGDVYILHYRLRRPPFTGVGVSLVILPAHSSTPIADHRQLETPLFRPGDDVRGTIGFGTSLIVRTEWSRAPAPDGYVYIYGHEEKIFKKLLVCRIRPEKIEMPDSWRFWNGSEWVVHIEESAPLMSALTGNISLELLPDGRLIALYADFSGGIHARIGESVTGPFGTDHVIYHTPERDYDPDNITYNPIAHSHLSEPGTLLINYSVNSWDFADLWRNCDWYLPKFIRLFTEDGS
jgi:hypothetical protein